MQKSFSKKLLFTLDDGRFSGSISYMNNTNDTIEAKVKDSMNWINNHVTRYGLHKAYKNEFSLERLTNILLDMCEPAMYVGPYEYRAICKRILARYGKEGMEIAFRKIEENNLKIRAAI